MVLAADGGAGLQAIREHVPDVVVSDIDMPAMTGVELCQALRADPTTNNLPVVFASDSLMPGDSLPEDAQATGFLRKPFEPRELVGCVDKALHSGHEDGQVPFACP